jgi:uncharacterized protein (AIM24 family)
MAQFDIVEYEGVSFVKVELQDETVRPESGALCYLFGDIVVNARLPSLGRAVRNILAEQPVISPTYSGTGVL